MVWILQRVVIFDPGNQSLLFQSVPCNLCSIKACRWTEEAVGWGGVSLQEKQVRFGNVKD